MRLRTVKNRLRKAGLPTLYVKKIYDKMKGYSDEDASVTGSANDLWIQTIAATMKDYLDSIKREAHTLTKELA